MEKSLRLPSYTLHFSPSKLDTTIAELFLHGTFRNLGVGGNPSLRFIVKIVTSTRIFSSAGDNTVIIPPLDRWTDRQREFTLVRTQSGVVHPSIFTVISVLCLRPIDRAEILYSTNIFISTNERNKRVELFIR